MYKGLSENIEERWNKTIYKNVQSVVNIYVDDVLLNPKYITDFKNGCEVFEDELELGSVPSQYIEIQIHKNAGIVNPRTIRIEYGILINQSLTVAEVNKMLVCDVNKLQVKSLSKYNNSFAMIPIGTYNVDDYNDEDNNVINIKALDNIIKLDKDNGYYDAKELIDKKGYATLGEIAQDICNKKGLELETSSFLNSDEKVAVYDNQLKARQYMSYIAEKAGGICCAGRNGKIQFRQLGQDTIEMPLNLFKTYKFGEEYKISRVAYEDGVRSFKFGNETRNTLWIRQENLFAVDEEGIEKIYNKINGLTINSFEGTAIIDPRIDIGDIIIIDGKPVIYQGEMRLNKRFIADICSKISIKAKQETTVKKENQIVVNRRVQSEINQIDGKITQLVEENTETSNKLSKHEQDIDSIKDSVHKLEDFTRTTTGTNQINLKETPKGEGYILELKIKGNTENFKYLTPLDTLTPNDTLVPNGGHFTLVCDKQSRTSMSNEAVEIDVILDNPLRNVGDVYDELNIIDGKTTVTRRIGVNDDGSLYVLDKETTETLQDVKLTTFEDNTYVYIKEFTGLEYTAKYIVKNEYSDKFITKVEADTKIEQKAESIDIGVNKKLENYSTTEEMKSAIQLKADEITSSVSNTYSTKNELSIAKSEIKQTTDDITSIVSKKVGNDELCSKISQSADKISLVGNRITITSSKFKLTEEGEVSVVDGSFKVISSEGTKLMDFSSSGIRYYNYNGDEIGGLVSTQQDSGHLFFTLYNGTSLNISKTSSDGSYFSNMVVFDDIDSVPYIRNTASGKLFKNTGEGITVENGLITGWSLSLSNFELNNVTITGIKVVDGLVASVTYQQN